MFKKIIGIIINRNEGGAKVVNDPNDKGGLTKFGISQRAYPNLDIKNLTLEQAEEIYYNDYFMKLPKIVNPNMLYQVLDMSINAGLKTALALYKPSMTVDEYKAARLKFYSSLSQFPIYKNSWLRRLDVKIV